MTREMFMLFAIGYYFLTMIIIVIVLLVISNKTKKKYLAQINELERQKNLVISAGILSELNKVESLINNDDLRKKYESWQKRFNEIKNDDIPKITDLINEVQEYFETKDYANLKASIIKTEMDLNYLQTKSGILLDEIKEITLSEERNRDKITKLKAEYRNVLTTYKEDPESYSKIKTPLELQFENVDKLFASFENAMDKNAYTEAPKIVKAIDDIVSNLNEIINETKTICLYGENLIPKKIEDIKLIYKKMVQSGYNLDYLNIEYNIEEANKKIIDIFQRLNVLDVEDSIFELKTMHDYFDSLYNDFENEKVSKRLFDDYMRSIGIKLSKLEKISQELFKKVDELKYSYDLTDEEVASIIEIKDNIIDNHNSYDHIIDIFRNKTLAYSKLASEMENINNKLLKNEDRLNHTLETLSSLKDDELRAKEQLAEIEEILKDCKLKAREYKLPVVPKNYYVEFAEASLAIKEMIAELEKRPISIKVLNMRVDTARDLVLKVYNTINETTKTAKMAEMAIVYGNRYRVVNKDVDFGLTKAENSFYKGNYKICLEQAISAINIVEPGIHHKLLENFKD
ncbi:MAG: septation ring formation regulator EzrA [Mycoplasma sp.]|nr:septation ring formation regulator EzrA [Mycoplasma sp.]MDD7149083.1 septation ring formation regulator EzrA [Mycoplasma sp.]MDY4544439.1 septation ring formation regulator EzrA [Bacilli bacterium]MDY4618934.1 septation ring formation regulator EzrA [Bacilli bacterium]